jgi:hypothetical protein
MRNGNHHTKAYRLDKQVPIRVLGGGEVRLPLSSGFKKQLKKCHHKKQRAWDKKVANGEQHGEK